MSERATRHSAGPETAERHSAGPETAERHPAVPPARGGRVVVVGDLVTDVLAVLAGPLAPGSDTPARIRMTGGGQAANTAAWLARCGVPVTLVAVTGDDPAGRDRIAELTAAGVDCAVRRVPGVPTGSVVVLVHGDERTMITNRGANRRLSVADVDTALSALADPRHLHLSGYPILDEQSRVAGLHALAAARTRGLTTSVDAASAAPLRPVAAAFLEWARGVDLLMANRDEAAVLAAAAGSPADSSPADVAAQARKLTGMAGAVVVKLGAAGALWVGANGRTVRVDQPPTTVVDPTGAGDAFAAGLLAAWLIGPTPTTADPTTADPTTADPTTADPTSTDPTSTDPTSTDPTSTDPTSVLRAGARLGAEAVTTPGARPRSPSCIDGEPASDRC